MAKRGWGGPSIREGSHPPPYMSIQHDLKECQQLLTTIQSILDSSAITGNKLSRIRAAMEMRPERHE